MYISIRKYKSQSPGEVIRRAGEGFVPIISSAPGFIAYYILDAGDGALASISIFETQAEAEESNRMAADWVKQNLAALVEGPPEITAGEVTVHKMK